MKTCIIICGPARTGSTSVTSWLHLRNDFVMFFTDCDADKESDKFLDTMIHSERFRSTLVSYFNPVQDKFETFISEKNRNLTPEKIQDIDYIGIRRDWGVLYFYQFIPCINLPIKAIFTMRKNLYHHFASLIFPPGRPNHFSSLSLEEGLEHYVLEMHSIYDNALQLRKEGEVDICAVDLTVSREAEILSYKRIAEFIGFEPDGLQREWIDQSIRQLEGKNCFNDPGYEDFKKNIEQLVRIPSDLFDHYDTTFNEFGESK